MGISGLLTALKSIQVTRHLSEFSGQTLAIDAYVWLHKGVFTCPTELATGKNTHKYVDYAMHRVRLLQYHNIQPYIVFDGGPLPAKKNTESSRKRRREEHLSRGNALALQGKHREARECYVKSVDVTPQMAYQFIKALRAENIPYVVAPYEADAQLAYLERMGIVNGVITEDSDLLVFGCQNVLLKLDVVASTVISISRKDFGTVTARRSDPNSISLVGWSDVQFRAMAILSGCDYLGSIPGVGLKTACFLLRKWKSVEQVVRVILLEGKKSVPPGYLERFRLAEKCFLHQRVYCPLEEKLVYLRPIDGDWDEDAEAYVGSDIDVALAKKLAMGDVDPITLLPMEDINPSFTPCAKLTPVASISKSSKEKGKMKEKPSSGGILSFFGPNPIIPPQKTQGQPIVCKQGWNRRPSGKRTLADVMEDDMAQKKRRQISPPKSVNSKFFGSSRDTSAHHRRGEETIAVARPSHSSAEKENIFTLVDDDEDDGLDGSDVSMKAQICLETELDFDLEEVDVVEQEDGYISPSTSISRNTEELSSPPRPGQTPKPFKRHHAEGDVFEVDDVPSPVAQRLHRPSNHSDDRNPDPTGDNTTIYLGPDLRGTLGDDRTSEIDCSEDDRQDHCSAGSNSASPPSPSPETPVSNPPSKSLRVVIDVDELDWIDLENQRSISEKAVSDGWKARWTLNHPKALPSKPRSLRRSESNVTPAGRHTLVRSQRAVPSKRVVVKGDALQKPRRLQPHETVWAKSPKNGDEGFESDEVMEVSMGARPHLHSERDVMARAQARLLQFRCD